MAAPVCYGVTLVRVCYIIYVPGLPGETFGGPELGQITLSGGSSRRSNGPTGKNNGEAQQGNNTQTTTL